MDYLHGIPIIADDTSDGVIFDMDDAASPTGKKGTGYIIRDYAAEPLGHRIKMADPEKIVSQSEWDALIDEQEERKSSLQHIHEFFGVKVKDQNGTLNCWANAPVSALELKFAEMGLKQPELSPGFIASMCGQFNGGLGIWAMDIMEKYGVPETKLWGANKNSRSGLNDPGLLANAAKYKVVEFRDLPSRNATIQAHHLLNNRPIPIGLNWWSHEVLAIRFIRIERGRYGYLIVNSWSTGWGKNGLGILDMNKGTADDAQVLYVANPYSLAT